MDGRFNYKDEILSRIDKINVCSKNLDNRIIVFEDLFDYDIKMEPAELGFLYTIALLYKIYVECGRISVDYIIEKIKIYDNNDNVKSHMKLVNNMRTYLYHNLNLMHTHDNQIKFTCENWFEKNCGNCTPQYGKEWQVCLDKLHKDSYEFLESILVCINNINKDDFKDEIIEEWILKKERDFPKYRFVELIDEVAINLGVKIDSKLLVDKKYSEWMRKLNYSTSVSRDNFIESAIKTIEYTLLTESATTMPITSHDIMRIFKLQPGKKIGELLKKALEIYEKDIYMSKESLIEKLSEFS